MNMKKTYIFGLCKDRHSLPVKDNIFPQWIDRRETAESLEKYVDERIPEDCGRIALFATGLMVAMLAVVAVCNKRGISLTVYNYDKHENVYNRQDVL